MSDIQVQETGKITAEAAELIKKTAEAMLKGAGNGSTPTAEEIADKAIAALKEQAGEEAPTMAAIKAMIQELLEARMGGEEEAKPGMHEDEGYKALKSEVAEIKGGLEKVAKAVEAEKDNARLPRSRYAPALQALCDQADFRKDGKRPEDVPHIARRWFELPTRAGLAKAAGIELVRRGGAELEAKIAGVDVTKATALTTTSIPGSPVDATPAWRTQLDPSKIAPLGKTVPVSGSQFKLLEVKVPAFDARTAVDPAANPTSAADALTSQTIDVKEFYKDFPAAEATLEDTEGVPMQIVEGFGQRYMEKMDEEVFAILKSSALTANKINTGAATGLPTADTMFSKLMALRKAVPLPYRNTAAFVVNSDIEALLYENYREGAGLAWNPITLNHGILQFGGNPVVVSDRLDQAAYTANEVVSMFGSWADAFTIGERIALNIYEQHYQPGYQLWAARGRFGVGVTDKTAYAVLQVAA